LTAREICSVLEKLRFFNRAPERQSHNA